jgi:hypothetical protein
MEMPALPKIEMPDINMNPMKVFCDAWEEWPAYVMNPVSSSREGLRDKPSDKNRCVRNSSSITGRR